MTAAETLARHANARVPTGGVPGGVGAVPPVVLYVYKRAEYLSQVLDALAEALKRSAPQGNGACLLISFDPGDRGGLGGAFPK